ncbi:uncharacterized protein K460DRAFT_380058 [Cucurbitaria berberidis CBS 394.84]|uniref:DUF3433 domain protein n=1 Tax=Cucurbitaria berberidis CBS 394.84 TaxID=1168544 RepID=A0A9P4L512_9PLEO|nr:uncharacterized protein K460DRAFT_380058 [Cucurbitaria berberidis CBS 394.84]KAF1842120.1 hypothetical protein K460DRAFT_380058 [Cucurbitaria berberidis CBS 394.84]
MEGVPSPLQIGSPTTRRPSEPSIPTALRVGSPAIGGTPPSHARPPLARKTTSGSSNRLSQLFPSRPSSVASSTPPESIPASRRTSYPSPLVPAAEPSYRTPRAPPRPSFAEDTSYNPSANAFSQQGASPSLQSNSGTKRLLSRLTSLRNGGSKGGNYNRLDDVESGSSKARLRGVEEADEAVGYDLSGLDGTPMKKFEPPKQKASATDAMERERHMSEAGLAAEFESFEAGIGAGMTSILQKPFTHTPTQPLQGTNAGHRRGLSASEIVNAQAKDAQKEAEKTGDIVAIADIPVDISDFAAGNDFDARSIMTTDTGLAKDEAQTSYFFPPDPEQPAWRPFTMGWPWIFLLIVVALSLAGLQEFLCQVSMKRVRDDPEGGLVQFKKAGDLTVTAYFTWQYAPIIFFVLYGILWQMTDFEVKRLEPFYQLSKKTGATAGESLNMDYLTFMSWLVPLRALRHKQFAVIYSSVGTLVASSLVPVLQSASINMYPPKSQRKTDGWKSVRIDPPWSRAVSACLVFVAFCGAALMYAMRRNSGLQSDPKGIAGIAAMATKSHILADFRGLDTAPLNKIHKQLRHRRFILHKSSLWQGEYIRNSKDKIHEHGTDPRPLMMKLRSGVPFIAFIVAFMASVPVFMFVESTSIVTEKLPFLMTGLATIIKILWNTMNCDIRMLQPFFILAKRHAPAKTLTLDYAGTNPLFLPFKAMLNGHYLVMLVAFGSILAEVLTVCVSSINVDGTKFVPGHGGENVKSEDDADDRYNTEQTFRSFWSSFALTMLILLYLIIIAILAYVKRSHKFMPRQIGTMASVLAFIHQSKMLVSFVDTEMFDSSKMTKHLEKSGKTYALGWFSGRDGDDHLGIDEEEILSEYKYGFDWTDSRLRPGQVGMWEHY